MQHCLEHGTAQYNVGIGSDHQVVSMKIGRSLRVGKQHPVSRQPYDWKAFSMNTDLQAKNSKEVRHRLQVLAAENKEEDFFARYDHIVISNMEAFRVPKKARVNLLI